jgi:hypothetical protein
MIIEAQEIIKRQNLVGDTEGFDMSLSADDMQWIMTLLSDLYKDPYSIVIQEWCSNAWDSHLEANKKHEPIVLEIKKDSIADKWYVAVQDFGVGLGPERIKIFGAYGKSTKRNSGDLIGGFGVGSKSIMCYTKSFFVDTCFDGIKYLYSISPNEEGIPRIDLLHEEETELSNRSRLWFYLKKDTSNYYSNSTAERTKFLEGAKRKTAYFDNLVYDLDSSLDNLNNYNRIEGNHFVYSEMKPFNNLHILLGQVPYEIDFQLLGLPTINIPIAIKVKEGVMPVPTREAIKYSDKSIQAIKEAITLASTELVEYCNKGRIDVTDWKVWLDTRDALPRVTLGKHEIIINSLVQYSTTPLKEVVFTPLKDVENVDNLGYSNLFPFHCVAKIQNGRKSDKISSSISYCNDFDRVLLSIEGQFESKVNSFIGKSDNLVYVFRKKNYKLKDYKSLLMLKRSNRETWRSQIVAYQKFVENEWLSIDSYDDIVVPKEVKVKGVRTVKPRDVVNIHVLREREKYDFTFKSATDVWPIKDFDDKRFNKLCIYGTKDDNVVLDAIWRCVPNHSMMLFHLTENNHKYLNKHNFIHVKDWKKTKAFSRIITAYQIRKLLNNNDKFTGETNWRGNYQEGLYSLNLKKLSSSYKKLIQELYEYQKKNLKATDEFNKDFMESCIETANVQKLWDYSIYHKIQQLEDMIEKFKFVEVFKSDANWTPVAANYIKKVNKNIRLGLKWYQNPKTIIENKI